MRLLKRKFPYNGGASIFLLRTMGTKYAKPAYKTFYVDDVVYQRARRQVQLKLGKPLSELVNNYLAKLADELSGEDSENISYEALKREYAKTVDDTRRWVRMLREMGALDTMHNLAVEYGLDFSDMHNVDDVIAKLLNTGDVPEEAVHMYIGLLEVSKQKRELGRELHVYRQRRYFSFGANANGENTEDYAQTFSVQEFDGVPEMRDASQDGA